MEAAIKDDITANRVLLYMKVRGGAVFHILMVMHPGSCHTFAAGNSSQLSKTYVLHAWITCAGDCDVFMPQGHPEAPMCGFSNMACQILNAYGALLYPIWPEL